MDVFDFLFPELAQAHHLRTLVDQGKTQARELRRQKWRDTLQRRPGHPSSDVSSQQRIAQLERELERAGLAIEALLEILDEAGVVTRDELAARILDIDARDGMIDGRTSSPTADAPSSGTA